MDDKVSMGVTEWVTPAHSVNDTPKLSARETSWVGETDEVKVVFNPSVRERV